SRPRRPGAEPGALREVPGEARGEGARTAQGEGAVRSQGRRQERRRRRKARQAGTEEEGSGAFEARWRSGQEEEGSVEDQEARPRRRSLEDGSRGWWRLAPPRAGRARRRRESFARRHAGPGGPRRCV